MYIFGSMLMAQAACSGGPEDSHARVERAEVQYVKDSVNTVPFAPLELSIPEYMSWVKQQTGVTYSVVETQAIKLSLMYKPLVLEAAMGAGDAKLTKKMLAHLEEVKAPYHHLLLEFTDKIKSAKPNHKELMKQLQENIYAIENGTDTLKNCITEAFPSILMGQPNQVLIMIPANTTIKKLLVGLHGEKLGLSAINIQITNEQIKTLPNLKLN